MRWYLPLRTASKPPSYMIERISDLRYVSEVSNSSPSNAKNILSEVIDKLKLHMDDEYADDLLTAKETILDSPMRAREIISMVIENMELDKYSYDRKKADPWKNLLT